MGRTARRGMVVGLAVVAVAAGACSSTPAPPAPSAAVASTTASTTASTSAPSTTTTAVPRSTHPSTTTSTTTTTVPPSSTTTSSVAPVPAGWVPYEDSSGVRLAHPPAWTTAAGQTSGFLVFIDAPGGSFRRNVNGLTQRDATTQSLAAYRKASAQGLAALGGTIIQEGPTTLSGQSAYEWRYRFTARGVQLECWGVAAVVDGTAWLFTYTADEARFAGAEADVATLFGSVELPA